MLALKYHYRLRQHRHDRHIRALLGRLVSADGGGSLLRNFGNYWPFEKTPHPKLLVPISRIALGFSNLAALITACLSKLGIILKSQNKFLKYKTFYQRQVTPCRNWNVLSIFRRRRGHHPWAHAVCFRKYFMTLIDRQIFKAYNVDN
jgi:hypothetical protein